MRRAASPWPRSKLRFSEPALTTATGPDGKFHLSQLSAGSYVLQFSGVGYRSSKISFHLASTDDAKEFAIALAPETFRLSDRIEVTSDVFELKDCSSVGELILTSSELRQTSTVLADDPFRSLQTLPGVSSSANHDFLAEFSVMVRLIPKSACMWTTFLCPICFTVANTPEAPSLSLFTGNDVEDIRLLSMAYPVRYADGIGAALAVRTRTGSDESAHFHGSAGLARSEILGEGRLTHKGTWLVNARKSYIGYLVNAVSNTRFSHDGFYDADAKLTSNLTPGQTFSFLITGGRLSIDDPSLPPIAPSDELRSSALGPVRATRKGINDLAIGRLGWRWTPSSHLVLDVYGAYVSTRSPLYSEASKMKNVNRKIKKTLAASRYLADTLTMQGYRNL